MYRRAGFGERYDTMPARERAIVRFYDETKAAIKSTEFYAYLVTFAGILIAAQVIGDGDSGTGASGDVFNANRAWLYLTILTVGYMVSRGLAKAGSGTPLTTRTRGAAAPTDASVQRIQPRRPARLRGCFRSWGADAGEPWLCVFGSPTWGRRGHEPSPGPAPMSAPDGGHDWSRTRGVGRREPALQRLAGRAACLRTARSSWMASLRPMSLAVRCGRSSSR